MCHLYYSSCKLQHELPVYKHFFCYKQSGRAAEHDISFPLQPRTNTEVKSHLQKPVCPFPFGSKIEKPRKNSSTKRFSSLKQDSLAPGLKFIQNSSILTAGPLAIWTLKNTVKAFSKICS